MCTDRDRLEVAARSSIASASSRGVGSRGLSGVARRRRRTVAQQVVGTELAADLLWPPIAPAVRGLALTAPYRSEKAGMCCEPRVNRRIPCRPAALLGLESANKEQEGVASTQEAR
jgi:hypothetical protein